MVNCINLIDMERHIMCLRKFCHTVTCQRYVADISVSGTANMHIADISDMHLHITTYGRVREEGRVEGEEGRGAEEGGKRGRGGGGLKREGKKGVREEGETRGGGRKIWLIII